MRKASLKLNALLNTITQLSAIILPFITFPYVTRILGPDNYGKVSFGNSIISYVNIVAALGIATYAVREGAAIREHKRKTEAFCSELFSFNLVSTAFAYLGLILLLVFWKDKADYRLLIVIQSVTVLANTLGVSWVFTIFEDYLFVAIRSILIQALSIVLVFVFIRSREDYVLYAVIGMAGGVLNNLLNMIYARKYVHIRLSPLTNLKTYLKPILVLFASSALITVYLSADVTMLEVMKGDQEVGVYEVAVKVYTIVKSVLNAVITVTIPRFAYYIGNKMEEEYQKLSKQTFETIILLALPALTGLIMVSRNVILIMSGEEYLGGTLALQILSVALIFAVSANFFVNAVLLSLKRDKVILIATIVSALVNVGLNFIFIPLWGLNGAAMTTLIAEATITVISFLNCRDVFSLKGTGKTLVSVALGMAVIVAVCMSVSLLNLNLLWDTLLKVAGSVVLYGAILLLLRKDLILGILKSKE